MTGRPSFYDEATATKILDAIADGQLLTAICKRRGMPKRSTVTSWISRNYNDFGDRYWQARASQAVIWSEQVLEILDDAASEDSMARAQIARSRSDARKWMLARMLPTRFSERFTVDHLADRSKIEILVQLPPKGGQLIDQAPARLERPGEGGEGS